MSIPVFIKTPDASLDYQFYWGEWLSTGEQIVNSVWTYNAGDQGISVSDASFDAQSATAYISGGVKGKAYTLKNTVTTDADPARTDSRTFTLYVAEK